MKEVIEFFESIGFKVSESNTSEDHFYMYNFLNQVEQIDVQGNENRISMRLILRHGVQEDVTYSFDKDIILNKISEWKEDYF